MAMSNYERIARDQISGILASQGYKTYALILQQLELNLTEDPTVIGFLDTKAARITVNKKLKKRQISTIIRHEILHAVLAHMARQVALQKKNAKFTNVPHDLVNIAADFEISNLGYTVDDKQTARNIILNNQTLRGLVTEDHFPDWQNKSFEEMLELLVDQQEKIGKQLLQQVQKWSGEGNSEIKELEDIIRRLEDVEDAAEEKAEQKEKEAETADKPEVAEKAKEEGEEAESIEDIVSRLTKRAEELKEKAKKSEKHQKSNAISGQDLEEQKELERRVDTFKRILNNPKIRDLVKGESTAKIVKSQGDIRNKKELNKYNRDPITQFELSLASFIKKIISERRDSTWKKINTVYARSSIVRPARARVETKKIPLVNVYFDRSGSFYGYPEKTRAAEEIISLLNKYVKQGKLKVDLYYGAVHVHKNKEDAEREGGGMESGPVIKHIKETKPDNVIVLTDSDSAVDDGVGVTVPGAVWILFFESRSNLGSYLTGELETNVYFTELNKGQ